MLSLRSLTAATAVLLLCLALTTGDSEEIKPKADSSEHLSDPQLGSEEHDSSSEDHKVEDKIFNDHNSDEHPFLHAHHSQDSDERPFFHGHHSQDSDKHPFFQGYGSYGSDERPFSQSYGSQDSDESPFFQAYGSYDSDERPFFYAHHLHRSWHPPRVMRPPLATLFTAPSNGVPVWHAPVSLHPNAFGTYIPSQKFAPNHVPFLPHGPPGFGGVAPLPFAPNLYYARHHHHHHHGHHHAPQLPAYAPMSPVAVAADPHLSHLPEDARTYMAFGDSEHDHHDHKLGEKHDGDHPDHHYAHGFPAYGHHAHAHGPHDLMNAYRPQFHAQAHYPNYPNYPANAYGPQFHAHAHYPNYPANAYVSQYHAHAHYPNYPANAYGPNFHAQAHYPNYPINAYGPQFHAHAHYPNYPAYAYGPNFHAQAHYPNYPVNAYGPQFLPHAHYPNYPAYAYGSQFHAYAHDSDDDDDYAHGLHFPAHDYDHDDDETYAYGPHLGAYPYDPLMSAYPYGSAYYAHDAHVHWPPQYAHMWPLHPDHYDSFNSLYWNQGGRCSWESPMPCWGTGMCVPLSSLCDNRFDCVNNIDEDTRLCVTGKRPDLQLMMIFFSLPDQEWMMNKLFNNRDYVYVAMAFKFTTTLHDLKWTLSLDGEAVNNTKALFQAAKDDTPDVAKNLGMKVEQWPMIKFFFRKITDAGFDVSKE